MSGTVLLAARSEYGYTDKSWLAMPHEPEAVSPEVQAEISTQSRNRFEIMRAEEVVRQEMRSRVNRLREFETEVRRRNLDPTRALSMVDRGIGMLEQMARGTFAA